MYIVDDNGVFMCQAMYVGKLVFIAHIGILQVPATVIAVYGGADPEERLIRKRYSYLRCSGYIAYFTFEHEEYASTTMSKHYMPYNKFKGKFMANLVPKS